MRRKVVLSILVLACAAVAVFLASPGTVAKVGQMLSLERPAAKRETGREAPRDVAVSTALATTADFPIRRYAIGFVASPAVVEVGARVSSQITEIKVKDGQMVSAGDVLFQLDDRALKAAVDKDQATLDKDQALLVSAQKDLVRAKDLVKSQAGTQQTYDQALAAEQSAEATVAADQATLEADKVQLSFATITSPITGRLGAVSVTIGDLVGPTTGGTAVSGALVTVTQMDPLWVQFTLPESDLPLLQKALAGPQPASVTLHKDGDPDPVGKGILDFVDSSVDTTSGTITARATLPNPGLSLWPGQYVNVMIEAGTLPQMTSVPTVAVQPSQKGPFVYVVKDDNTVEMRPVQVALTEGTNSAVQTGLKGGERVVVEGQARLKNGTPIRESANTAAPAAPEVAEGGAQPAGTR